MSAIAQYDTFVQAALAGYAVGLVPFEDNSRRYTRVGMAESQARSFDDTWAVLQQSVPNGDGFSAVLLQRKDEAGNATGEKVLAIAGTDPSSPPDRFADTLVALFGTVLGMSQYASLELFYQQLVSASKLGAGEQFVVTGHSLGGFLAEAFTARHTNVVSAAYTYNAMGLGTFETMLRFFGITDASAAARITNVYATDGPSGDRTADVPHASDVDQGHKTVSDSFGEFSRSSGRRPMAAVL